ncbi:NtaA/DmoA family FMN-dependent monooxygenase [Herbiconiux moechotypicola]|uniref:LLM class flavin-dependent oxidoreductase n=1 Tax=Herbiconiux moechotypicola TaxID=637393 RepID=A0ABP5Q6U1_9MICO|nr:NtaA/DmoA family FMN-dependent monooxygenase [Herbiconiux moechotypicola]MCS5728869.1 NtaA/DmoA family FMN-dependent monooxygenase [Herbiconiux moechotypicola]
MTRRLTLGIFQFLAPSGMTGGSWRHPDNTAVDFLDIEHWTTLARRFERAGFDFLFFADSYGYPELEHQVIPDAVRDAIQFPQGDPIVIVSAVAAVTERLGIVATASTMVERPQAIARRYATLDNFTKGRLGWNIVTGAGQGSSARLFGEELTPHDTRYDMAEDHVQIALKLWEGSWEPDALRLDKEGRVYADPAKVHEISHAGPYFSANGLLTVPPSPQQTPFLLQAGTSGRGKDFAARYAEGVFLAGGEVSHIAANVADIRARAAAFGRDPRAIKFVVGASFITAPTREEAEAKREEMLTLSTTENAATAYAYYTGLDLLAMDQDAPLGGGTRTELGQSNVDRFTGENGATVKTVGEILEDFRRNGVNGTTFVGTPAEIADEVEAFIEATDADGFLIQPYLTPGTYDDLIELLLPEFHRRGLHSPEYEGTTLREHFQGEGRKRLADDHPGAAFRP